MRTFAKVSLAILLTAVLAWAGEPWKNKPFQDWNKKETLQILNHSPWAKFTEVVATWEKASLLMAGPADEQSTMGGQNGMGQGMPSHPNMGGGGMPGGNAGMGQRVSAHRNASFEARWISAKTMREALARDQVLEGRMAMPDAEQYAEKTVPDYEIIVFGRDMTPFQKLDKVDLTKHTYLQVKREKLAPAGVRISRSPDGKRVMAVTFIFAKQENGKPTIPAKAKKIELICKAKGATLKFHFDPHKMQDKTGRDL